MATAKQLLCAQNAGSVFEGKAFVGIDLVHEVVEGTINHRATYIQAFNTQTFFGIDPDVTFVTPRGEKCYLYKIAA